MGWVSEKELSKVGHWVKVDVVRFGAPIRVEGRIHPRSRVKERVSRLEGLRNLTVSLEATKGLTPTWC